MATFDLNILPIHRLNGQESADLPGLLAVTPPRKSGRGREKDNLIVYLMLSGNAIFSAAELSQLNDAAANAFYQSPGSLTSAMRKAAETINATLLARNLSTSGRGQYALGLLALVVVREAQCTLLLSGPAHGVWVGEGGTRHIHDAALSGKGVGSSQSFQTYFSQVELHDNDLLVLCGRFPRDWEADLLSERPPASLDAAYRKLTFTKGDLNAALIQAKSGHGVITLLRPEVGSRPSQPRPVSVVEEPFASDEETFLPPADEAQTEAEPPAAEPQESSAPSITEDELDRLADFAAHLVQPSAYAIPPQPHDNVPPLPAEESPVTPLAATSPVPSSPRTFPPSIPRLQPAASTPVTPKVEAARPEEPEEEPEEEALEAEEPAPRRPRRERSNAHAEATRQMAKIMVNGIQTGRRTNERLGAFFQRLIPRLLPNAESESQHQSFTVPTSLMVAIAIVIPLMVSVVSWVIYDKYGLNERYNELYKSALVANAQAASETDPARQRDELTQVISLADHAMEYRETDEAQQLRNEAQARLDTLMGVIRLEFIPAFTNGAGGSTQISRMTASESDLYMLNAEGGNILHASFTGRSLELDNAFNCQPGTYAGYQVDTLVDLLALPKVNAVGASVLGIDATGHLLYCAPGQVPQAFPLPPLPNTNWGRVTAFALDNDNLYVLDSTSRAVWVFVGKNGSFVDTPYFYFGTQIPATIDTAIDLAVSGDDLYLLHADGHVSTCTFSRINETPTRCIDPANFQDPFAAHADINVFAEANFTQMTLTSPPTPVILLLDSDRQGVFRFSPRTLELLNQIRGHAGRGNPFQPGPITAMTVSPNYVLYLAIGNQVYFAPNLP